MLGEFAEDFESRAERRAPVVPRSVLPAARNWRVPAALRAKPRAITAERRGFSVAVGTAFVESTTNAEIQWLR